MHFNLLIFSYFVVFVLSSLAPLTQLCSSLLFTSQTDLHFCAILFSLFAFFSGQWQHIFHALPLPAMSVLLYFLCMVCVCVYERQRWGRGKGEEHECIGLTFHHSYIRGNYSLFHLFSSWLHIWISHSVMGCP